MSKKGNNNNDDDDDDEWSEDSIDLNLRHQEQNSNRSSQPRPPREFPSSAITTHNNNSNNHNMYRSVDVSVYSDITENDAGAGNNAFRPARGGPGGGQGGQSSKAGSQQSTTADGSGQLLGIPSLIKPKKKVWLMPPIPVKPFVPVPKEKER